MIRMLGGVLAALMLVLLQGCVTEGGNNRSGAEGGGGPRSTTATVGEAPGAPIDIPAITIAEGQTCQYSGNTDPPDGTEVERGSTVTLVMGSKPCTDANGDGVSDDNDGDGLPDDTDADGTPDVLDDGADGDGIPDAEQSPS